MTTNVENKKLQKVSSSQKPHDKKYPVIHYEHEVVVHPPIPKSMCPYCNFVNEDGSNKDRGQNFSNDIRDELFITDQGTIEGISNPNFNPSCVESIKINYCPFCRRKL